jgi:hypothetical protein
VRDGQTRLHAIVEAGIPIHRVVARGVGEDAFDVMDTVDRVMPPMFSTYTGTHPRMG